MKKGCYKTCKCGNQFYEFPYMKGKTKFCSTNCANKANAKKNSESKIGKNNPMYGISPWNKKKGHLMDYMPKGESHYNWKGGTKDESKKGRSSFEWRKWREKVFKRDSYTCQICKVKGGDLIPHHIKLFRFFKKDRYKVVNGVTLCRRCHRGLHNKNVDKRIINI